MKQWFIFTSAILLLLSCHTTKPLAGESKDLSVKAINDILQIRYRNIHSADPCENGTFKIVVSDSLFWRNFKDASNAESTLILAKYKVDNNEIKKASGLLKNSGDIEFSLNRIDFKQHPNEDSDCIVYYFSPLLSTNVPGNFIMQSIQHRYGYSGESVLLLKLKKDQFVIQDYLILQEVWF